MSPAYINCEILPGLFDSEYYVAVNGSSAYYVSKENVKLRNEQPSADNPVNGVVYGYIVLQENSKTLVQLPGEPARDNGVRTWVATEDVHAL